MRTIKPVNHNGSIQLKFSVSGKRYSFNPIPGGKYEDARDLATASAIATRIQNDILAGNFDITLNRYRLTPKVSKTSQGKPNNLLELYDAWVESLDLSAYTQANHYKWLRVMISKASPALASTSWLTESKISARTFKDRLSMMKACGKWAVTKGWLETNPYECIKPRKQQIDQEVKPFTLDEIKRIIEGFEVYYPYYSPFVRFLLATGVRTAEAIGLRWSHIDFDRTEITIRESLPKDLTGNGYTRIRKETKTGSIRYLPLTDSLRSLLQDIKPTKVNPDDLVFTTPTGKPISLDNFRKRQWSKILEIQGIPYRHPYVARHSMASHAIDQGIPMTGVAYLLGHKDTTMVIKVYGHRVNKPKLPDIPIT